MRLLLLLLLLLTVPAPANAEIYTWKQGGVAHYTNQPDTIPPRYRSKAKVLALPGEEKGGQGIHGQGTAAPSVSTLPLPPPPPAAVSPRAPARPEGATGRRGRRGADEE